MIFIPAPLFHSSEDDEGGKPKNGAQLTSSQRDCLLHVLRNCATAMVGAIRMLEKPGRKFSPEELSMWLSSTDTALHQIVDAGAKGNFCSLRPEQCEFVGPCIGCPNYPGKKPS